MTESRPSHVGVFRLAATELLAGAVVHLGAWVGGPGWMAALGAPPSIVASAEAGTWQAPLGTLAIVALLAGLAFCCLLAATSSARSLLLRGILAPFAILFLVRGLLVVPFLLAGRREWRTPVGIFVVTGQWFVTGSLIVLGIGVLISLGLYRTRPRLRLR